MYKLAIKDNKKILLSKNYNYVFDLTDGLFLRWGRKHFDDPQFSPFGPEILDIEITTKCNGVNGKLCSYCYKSNTKDGHNMSYETFVDILNKVNENQQLCQLAFGLGSTAEENPDLWKMCEYARSQNIIPNGTIADITDETADKIAQNFGACAVSIHNKENGYGSVKKLTDRGMTQCNIHQVIYNENYEEILQLIDDIKKDSRLEKLNAVVFLSLKKTGRAENNKNMTQMSQENFNELILYALEKNINFGMDSCSAIKFLKFIEMYPEYKYFETYIEPCESFGLFSSYVNVMGKYYPCSFVEMIKDYPYFADLTKVKSFTKEVWQSEWMKKIRNKSLKNNRKCLDFQI